MSCGETFGNQRFARCRRGSISWAPARAHRRRTIDLLNLFAFTLATLLAPPLQFSDVLARIDSSHPKLTSARAAVEAERGNAREKRGAFDPVLTVGSDTLRYNTATDPGKAAESAALEAAIELPTRSGLSFVAGSRLARGKVKSPTSATGLFESFVGVKVPLLRGAGGLNERAIAERQAGLGVTLAERDFDAVRLSTRLGGASAYWQWVAAARRLGIAREILSIAQVRANGIAERVRVGDLPEVDSIEASVEVERRRGGLAGAERDLQKSAIKLSLYLWTESERPIVPRVGAVLPNLPEPTDLSVDDEKLLTRTAQTRRPELTQADVVRGSLALTRDLARADRRPRLDLTLGPGYDVGGIGNTMKAGLLFSVPLRQNTVDGRVEEAEAKLAKFQADRANLEGAILAEVSDAASAVRFAYRRNLAARAELELARRLEKAERDRFELGEGTIFLLNQRERARAEAESRLVDILAEYNAARAALQAASGVL